MIIHDKKHPLVQGLTFDMPFFEGGGTVSRDIGPKKRNGTFNSSPTWEKSYFGPVVQMNGTSSYISFSSPITTAANEGITLSCMFKSTTGANSALLGIRNGDTGNGNWTMFRLNGDAGGGKIEWIHDFFNGGTNNRVTSSTGSYNNDVWHIVTGTYDGSTLRIYIDGVPDGTFSKTGLLLSATGSWAIGRRNDFAAEYFNGQIGFARVWKRCLTPKEVALLSANPWCIYERPSIFNLGKTFAGNLYSQTLTEAIIIADTISKISGKSLLETVILSDILSKNFSRIFSETITIIDILRKTYSHLLGETVTIVDSITKSIGKVILNSLTIVDTVNKSITRLLTETITIVEAFVTSLLGLSKYLIEQISLTDSITILFNSLTGGIQKLLDNPIRDFFQKKIGGSVTDSLNKPSGVSAKNTDKPQSR